MSTSEVLKVLGADDETRTRDPHLGKVMRYQLRYIRMLSGSGTSVVREQTLSVGSKFSKSPAQGRSWRVCTMVRRWVGREIAVTR